MYVTVIFHSPDMPRVSPAVQLSWGGTVAELLRLLWPPYPRADLPEPAAAEFVAACIRDPRAGSGRVEIANVPYPPAWHSDAGDRFEWYRLVMSDVRGWEPPPVLVNMDPPYEIERGGAVLGRWLPSVPLKETASD